MSDELLIWELPVYVMTWVVYTGCHGSRQTENSRQAVPGIVRTKQENTTRLTIVKERNPTSCRVGGREREMRHRPLAAYT